MSASIDVDLEDFDAVGILSNALTTLRASSAETSRPGSADISAPQGWHRVAIDITANGHLVAHADLGELSRSRRNNVAAALEERSWQLDEDRDGFTRRYPPGSDMTTISFELLAVMTLGGAPSGIRHLTMVDEHGGAIDLG